MRQREKPSNAEIERRVRDIFPLVLACERRRNIYAFVASQTSWSHVCARTIDRYIKRCDEIIRASAAINRDYEIGAARARLRSLYARAWARGDLEGCRRIQKDMTDLFRLAGPLQIEVEVTDAERREAEAILTEQIKAELVAEAERITRESCPS